jgi:SAM-dependent methyltransferase
MPSIDSIYYRDAGDIATARSISAKARRAVYELFVQECKPNGDTRILDIGVSDEEGPESNMLEQCYPWRNQILCAGLGDGRQLLEKYPGISYLKIEAGKKLPFDDGKFDVVYSNAVLEHVGGKTERIKFVQEARRVGRTIFFVVPNRWFPVEHHTAIPLVHWNADLFRFMTRKGKLSFWSDPKNLEFLSALSLGREFPFARFVYTGLHFGMFSSNIAMIS